MFVTNWNSTTKIQKISEITNFFRHYFLSRTEVYRYDTNPDNAQKVAPANESRTQVAVNSQGKTNEATKNVNEPLQNGQTAPKDDIQQKQEKRKSKGMKL